MKNTNSNESPSHVRPGESAQTWSKDAQPHKDANPSTSGEKPNAEKSAPAKGDVAGSSRR